MKNGVRSDRKMLSIIIGAVAFAAVIYGVVIFCIPCFARENKKQGVNDKIEESEEKSSVVQHPRVLFLSSYAYDWESVPKQLEGITDVLNGKAQVDYIFMDTKKMDLATVEEQICKHIDYNMEKDGAYNVVILGDDAALDFALKYQDTLFAKIPLVFEGINTEEKAQEAAKDPLITGVVEQFPIEDTIRVARNLCPKATHIVGISDSTESGRGSTKQFYDSDKRLSMVFDISRLYSWEYDMVHQRAILDKRVQKDFSWESVIENFSENMIQSHQIARESIEDFRQMHKRLRSGEREVTEDICFLHEDSTRQWLRITYFYGKDSNEENMAIAAAMDVTEQHQTFERYKDALALHATRENDVEANMSIDITENIIIDYDYSVMPDFDIRPGDAIEQIVKEIAKDVDEAYKTEFLKLYNLEKLRSSYSNGNSRLSFDYRRKWRGKNIWMNTTVNLLEHPESNHIIAFITTKDIHYEMTLSKALSRTVEEGMDTASVVEIATGKSMLITAKKDEKYLPVKEDHDYVESVRENIGQYVYPEDQERCHQAFALANICEYLKTEEEYSILYRMMPQKDEIRWKKTRVFYLNDRKEELIFVRTDVTDVHETEQKNQEKLKQIAQIAEKASAAKSEFLSNMSHEIRTPLNAIIGMTKLVEEESSTTFDRNYYVKQIDTSSQYLLGHINDILDMSRIESGRLELSPEWTTIGDVLNPCIEMMIPLVKSKGIIFQYPDRTQIQEDREAYIDALRVKQILMNLLNNAYKFTDKGGTIVFSFKTVKEDDTYCYREYYVEDTGCGMSQEFLKRIFEPFEQEHRAHYNSVRGTGLGLTLVKKLLEKMDGSIGIESELGKGTRITLHVKYQYRDAVESGKMEEKMDEEKIRKILQGKRILVAEDNEINIAVIDNLLVARGMLPEIAVNGRIALDKFLETAPGTYDAILMDIRMDVMDGMEATRRIRRADHEEAKKIPIIAMSANAFEEDVRQGMEAGMNEYLTKPINPQKLFETLAIHMEQQV